MTQAELHAVRHHQRILAKERSADVTFEEALAHWQEHHAIEWREARQAEYLRLQREEILRHKWIESEKAKCDLGSQAVLDWISNHAASWRDWYESEQESSLS